MEGAILDLTGPMHYPWQTVLIFAMYTIPNVAGLVIMKYGLTAARDLWRSGSYFEPQTILIVVGGGLYVLGFFIWLAILARYELSQAYPVAIGLTLVFSSLASGLLLGEPMPFLRIAGIVVVFIGIWMVAQ